MIDLSYRQLVGIGVGSVVGLVQGLVVYGVGQMVVGAARLPQPMLTSDALLISSGLLVIILAAITSLSGFAGGVLAGVLSSGLVSGAQIGGTGGVLVGVASMAMTGETLAGNYVGLTVGLAAGLMAGAVAGGIKILVREERYL
ncbi:MAG: hypothetical protein KDI02_13220 [Anaerolineae bacterium]|nr:hypothetical protein [Anaerolineae bacterium]MCB0224644.1 hypothetical protein [Anaerolineae bacterium]MCB9108752.1 hypothetical protein [Anaerolineales bacterium]